MKANQFWVVWNENGAQPVVKHDCEESACREAARLARLHRGQRFVVLAPVRAVTVTDERWDTFGSDDSLPF